MIEILTSPILWQALGFTTACGIMISPIYYNGDYGKPIRAIVVLGVCGFFSLMVSATGDYSRWEDYTFVSLLINSCFILGLYLGVYLYNLNTNCDNHLNCKK